MNNYNFTFYEDQSHGWLEVPLSLVRKLGIQNKISKYSYFSSLKNMVYLEEDLDAQLFAEAMKEKDLDFSVMNTIYEINSRIRNLPRYEHKEN